MIKVGLAVRLEVKPGKEDEIEKLLTSGLTLVNEEAGTVDWFAIRIGPTTFGIFDTFPNDAARQAHLSGRLAGALMAKAGELLSSPPKIEMVDIIAAKMH
ncbi:hypothetical protein AKJ09_03947 [Labilithrix luteola]|uniref:Antibiotic biosynthesis monooxygenase n=1 Tax=Labilithrix luteola TaxID=1391654 RepID=A0A0K1PUS8_9BACT|nr:antibiotic biosynthesis monooxygenase [Labilithrix luteola]AKU97283.1 hypothetical protein AKJ09_03947 [Labilithrix luteola]